MPGAAVDVGIIEVAFGELRVYQRNRDVLLNGFGDLGRGRVPEHQDFAGNASPAQLEARGVSYSPVPGGVGPVTLAVLLENIVLSGERKI